ncbi:Fis family transcriptional regulator [Comamonas thiooxydans]|uniref:Fis family transcriptional regulator n=1 Tax=Comamonas thiooxydans TaxID=363952 RepID=A0A0E3BDJ3_9BURK|nr:Fis family transcriptional regulator [Comamonas thiooxydans]GAO71297.1 Fis family transcriptional regulator [Comamonas sp. E6]
MTSSPHSSAAASILVVDDEPDLRTLYELTLLREGYRVETAGSVQEGMTQLQGRNFDVLITDMRLPDGIGMELLLQLRDQSRSERCIVMTAYGSAENAVEALRAGAFDYLTKPVDLRQFRQVVASAVQGIGAVPKPGNPQTSDSSAAGGTGAGTPTGALEALVGRSQAMQLVKQRIAKVAKGMAPVLIHGESGTGKELVARALHGCSQRAGGPMVAVNCGAIPESLLEAEFFGARKGSYTGATQDRPGYFQAAQGGTLFLDEIGDLPLAMQAKLLRAIQERKIRPLGSTQEEAVDVRIVSATHRDLGAEVQAGNFRQDLFYRLNVIEIELPALRERREDLGQLCQALLQKLARESGLATPELDDISLSQIARLPLPGNVRELENVLHRAIALGEEGPLRLPESGVPAECAGVAVAASSGAWASSAPPPQTQHAGSPAMLPEDLQGWLDEQERSILVRALQDNGFNRTATAARLGISLRQIRYRIDRLGIDLPAEGSKHQSDNV